MCPDAGRGGPMCKHAALAGAIALAFAGCDGDDLDDSVPDPGVTPDAAPEPPPSQGTSFSFSMSPALEVPVCAAASIYATGAADVTISADRSTITVDLLTFVGLSSAVTAAHI